MEKVNLMIGRFQPFTNGHYKCVQVAKEKKGLPTVVAMINTRDEKVDEKHPFPTSMMLPLYMEMFKKDDNIKDFVLVNSADIVKIGELFKEKGYQIASWTCGTDRLATYDRMATKYSEQAGLSDDFEMIEIKRGDEDISATQVRNALKAGDKAKFYSLIPQITLPVRLKFDYYEKLKTQIDKI